MKLGLGTVQFGLDYGVSNAAGRTPDDEAARILRLATDSGIRVIDTAAGYGVSEEVLGRILPVPNPFAIVTKTPASRAGEISSEYLARVRQTFRSSLEKLGQQKVFGVLVHRAEDLLAPHGDGLMRVLVEFKQTGLVDKVGVSVYNAAQLDAILDRHEIDLVQLPVSVFDQRLLASGHLAKLNRAKIEVHARSVFLQGLLLMHPDTVPAFFAPISEHLALYHAHIAKLGLTPLQAALGFVLGLTEVDHFILGVNSATQLEGVLAAQASNTDIKDMSRFALSDTAMLDPSGWRL